MTVQVYHPAGDLELLWARARAHPLALSTGPPPGFGNIGEELRELVGLKGKVTRVVTVLLGAGGEQGNHIQEHAHPEHVILWYPLGASVEVAGEEVVMGPGEVICLPPGTRHGVRRVTKPRLSVAVLVEEGVFDGE